MCFLNFLFDILTAECHAAAVAPRQRCSGVEAPPQRKIDVNLAVLAADLNRARCIFRIISFVTIPRKFGEPPSPHPQIQTADVANRRQPLDFCLELRFIADILRV